MIFSDLNVIDFVGLVVDIYEWIEVVVLGGVYEILIVVGIIVYLYVEDYEKDCCWVEDCVWWYCGMVLILVGDDLFVLILIGVDIVVDIWVNGYYVGCYVN